MLVKNEAVKVNNFLTCWISGKAYEIEEDPDVSASLPFLFRYLSELNIRSSQWEAYDLGRAPEPSSGADLSRANHALTTNLELARSAGSRYLVQRWGDGTLCDKTGKRREIEVQVGSRHQDASIYSHMRTYVHVSRLSSTAP